MFYGYIILMIVVHVYHDFYYVQSSIIDSSMLAGTDNYNNTYLPQHILSLSNIEFASLQPLQEIVVVFVSHLFNIMQCTPQLQETQHRACN